jgi:hypothetical protein
MASVTVTLSTTTPYTDVIVAWTAPDSHSSPITEYNILFLKADGSYDT